MQLQEPLATPSSFRFSKSAGAEFPMTITGKVQKFIMREHMIKELGLSVEETA